MFPAYGSKCLSISLYLCSFHVPVTSFHVHFICLWSLCPVILEKKRISTHVRFIFFHDLPCLLMFLFSFLLPTFFYFLFTLLYFNAFHFLPLSFHARYFPCPSILCSYPFIVPPCHVQNFIDRIFGMRDRGRHGGHTLYVWILKKQLYTHTKTFPFVVVPFPFHFCSHSFDAFLFSFLSL